LDLAFDRKRAVSAVSAPLRDCFLAVSRPLAARLANHCASPLRPASNGTRSCTGRVSPTTSS
jgi:hypothetical protein